MVVPIATVAAAQDALVTLFVVLLAAKLGEEVCRRTGQPPILGEIVAGALIGPSVFALVSPGDVLEVFSELGVVFLLFVVGLQTRLSEMRAVGASALRVGLLGAAVPFAAGFVLGEAIGDGLKTSLFIGAALMATSAGITSKVLLDLGAAERLASRVILGAAVVDDVLALLTLSVIVAVAGEGGVSFSSVALLLLIAVSFIGVVAVAGSRLLARHPEALKAPAFTTTGLLPAVLLCLGLAALAGEIGLAAVIGSFLAGMIVAETKGHTAVERDIAPLYAFFAPFFFAYIGLRVDLGALFASGAIALLVGVTVIAVATKFVGAWAGGRGLEPSERLLVAVGMVPRGEVGVIVAGIGRSAGVIDAKLFAVIVAMAVLTTLISPPALARLLRDATVRPR